MEEFSGDQPLGIRKKLLYLICNLIRGVWGYRCALPSEYLYFNQIEKGINSPSRKYANQFLLKKLPTIIPIGDIRVLDIGCGTKHLLEVLINLGYQGRYIGIDIQETMDTKTINNTFESVFVKSKIECYETNIKFDLIFSNTALEHIKDDKLTISKCHHFLKPGGKQIHIIPSFWSLFLYLWHGYRQYSPTQIRNLVGGVTCQIYRLGGLFSFFLHLLFITIPAFLIKTDKLRDRSFFQILMRACNRFDTILPICSSLYIIVLQKDPSTLTDFHIK